MKHLPTKIIYPKETDIKNIYGRLTHIITHWIEDWCFNPEELKLSPISLDTVEGSHIAFGNPHPAMYLFEQGTDWENIIYGKHASHIPKDDIAQKLKENATKELFSRIQGELFSSTSEGKENGDNDSFETKSLYPAKSNFLGILFNYKTESFAIIINLAKLKENISHSTTSKKTLSNEKISLVDKKIPINIRLSLGQYSINEINELTPGDILTSKVNISSLFDIYIDKNHISKCRPIRLEENRAIKVTKNDR
ncbi:FliM/FliN family flagellar motor C-terminal domain-containing protein [Teredinibacter sp. KSP-S5-2]|uniref:FliM/FliN family flagellar motor C-terminal domain-containing protein n=1 Tax=Teredinibacter sp. KSP-S5-2 TaxID=3034506 RepID=UPI0029352B4E|nr:FliM/FliN family flagellar motor C-terminal domain-containing protein [Teredinibacter sp. KSP-S5-2]WNO11332.1 FliM/FliN family flagellar motor C-terminal domain-containing protein [Teredinibacter sp. KSP-S5-2]